MAEAIISRRGGGSGSSEPEIPPQLKTETITYNTTWTVPSNIKGNISVRIFGGGGGGGGFMNPGKHGGYFRSGGNIGGRGGFYGGFARGGNGGSGSVAAENRTNGICIVQYFHY